MMNDLPPSPLIGTMLHLTPNIGTPSFSPGKSITAILLRTHPHLPSGGFHRLNKQSKISDVNFIAIATLLRVRGSYLRARDHLPEEGYLNQKINHIICLSIRHKLFPKLLHQFQVLCKLPLQHLYLLLIPIHLKRRIKTKMKPLCMTMSQERKVDAKFALRNICISYPRTNTLTWTIFLFIREI
jgi:hypothetical protein